MGWGGVGWSGVECGGLWWGGCLCVCEVCAGACVCGVCVRSRGEKVSLAPLYYPDTLVNPDTCLGKRHSFLQCQSRLRVVIMKVQIPLLILICNSGKV